MLRRLYTINFIDAFISGATTVIVPLLMLERGIDIATIGLVFAAAPFAKALVRVAGAAIADSLGDRVMYISSSFANLLLSFAYLFSTTAAGFGAGKLLDGARESSIWSVIRPSLMAASPEKKHFALTDLLSGRLVYNALGCLAVGALFLIGGYGLPLFALVCLSAYLIYSSFRLKNFHRAKKSTKMSDLSPLGRSRRFYEIAGAFTIGSMFYAVAFYMAIPLYFKMQGFSLAEIGLFYAAYYLLQGVSLNLLSHRKAKTGMAALAGVSLYCAGLAGIALAPHSLIPAFFLLMSLGDAGLALLWEQLNYVAARNSSKRATDLSLLVTPSFFGVMAVSWASGISISAFGFLHFFALLALSEISFAAWTLRIGGMRE